MGRRPRVIVTRQIGRGFPKRVYALIPLNTEKIRSKMLQQLKRRQKTLDKLKEQYRFFYEKEQPEYNQFYMVRCGAALSEERVIREKLDLVRSRLDKIRSLSYEYDISEAELCSRLRGKVTANKDIWEVLEEEIAIAEERCRKEEEERRKRLEERRRKRQAKAGINSGRIDIDDVLKHIFSDLGLEDDDFTEDFDSGPGSNSFFGKMDFAPAEESEETKRLKQVYRELCQKYHPDKVTNYDDGAKRVWLEILEAYRDGDLDKLMAIRSRMNAGSDFRSLSCSELDTMIDDLNATIHKIRCLNSDVKRQIAWGFLKLGPEEKERNIQLELAKIKYRCEIAEDSLKTCEARLSRILNAVSVVPKPRMKTKKRSKSRVTDDFIEEFLFGDLDFDE